jgi:thiol-disulfide isomerase/thioredoxin
VFVLGACSAAQPEPRPVAAVAHTAPEPAQQAPECPVPRAPELTSEPEVISPDERVPDFVVASKSCQVFDSRDLVGKQPFVLVFFASWCNVCEHKMPALREALMERAGELTPIFISLDEPEAWQDTEAFLERYGIRPGAAVAGRDFLGFSLGYNPFRSVPVVVVVGRSGHVVDVQIGVREDDEQRLGLALDAAIEESPAEERLTSYPPR